MARPHIHVRMRLSLTVSVHPAVQADPFAQIKDPTAVYAFTESSTYGSMHGGGFNQVCTCIGVSAHGGRPK